MLFSWHLHRELGLRGLVRSHNLIPELSSMHPAAQLGTQQEASTEFPVQTIRFVGWWLESVLEHDGDQFLDVFGDGLRPKVVRLLGKRFSQELHRSEVCLHHGIVFLAGEVPHLTRIGFHG